MCIPKGSIVRTKMYNCGPYVIMEITGPCTCPRYLDTLGGNNRVMARSSPEHYHFVCCALEDKNDKYYLGGYVKQGDRIMSVWYDDEIYIDGIQKNTQLELF